MCAGLDGVVVRLKDTAEQRSAGVRTRFPHRAIAVKLPAVERQTVLEAAEWEVGRTGCPHRPRSERNPGRKTHPRRAPTRSHRAASTCLRFDHPRQCMCRAGSGFVPAVRHGAAGGGRA
ncbi:hypothetical protein GCM10010286_15390 [Streptomyces toxytricini]|nr:hypothetical protein GCM10010286_15390 [Streptomyces toxytricini]